MELEAIELYEAGEAQLSTQELRAIGAAFNDVGIIAKAATSLAGEGIRYAWPRDRIEASNPTRLGAARRGSVNVSRARRMQRR